MTVPCISQQQRYEEQIAHFLARVSVCTMKTLECYQASPVMAGNFASTELGHRAAHSLLSRAELGFFRRASRSVRLKALIPLILTTSSSHKTLSEQQVRTDEGLSWIRVAATSPHPHLLPAQVSQTVVSLQRIGGGGRGYSSAQGHVPGGVEKGSMLQHSQGRPRGPVKV